jgi:histidinol-phosphatase (PHP family)
VEVNALILVDYHMHSHVSHDAVGSVAEHVRAAEERGLAEICFTEHLDFFPAADGLSCATIPNEDQLLGYLEEVSAARQHAGIAVRAGLEVDYKPEADRWVRELLGRIDFDFLLGSVHNVGTWPVSGPPEMALAYFQERGAEQGCLDYLAVLEQAVATDLFDSVAHLDLMKRFRPENGALMKRGRLRDKIVEILDLMASNGTGIEVNAAGLVHDPREAYPSLYLLTLARERGVEVLTVGSDSHRPETVGRQIETAISLARAAGFTHVYTFDQRALTPRPL